MIVGAVALALVCALGVWLQSQTLSFGDFIWTRVQFFPFSEKSVHIVKYGQDTLCANLLDVGEAPYVSANLDRTLTVSYGRVGGGDYTALHYSVDRHDFVAAPDLDNYGFEFTFDTLTLDESDVNFGQVVRRFRERMLAWRGRN